MAARKQKKLQENQAAKQSTEPVVLSEATLRSIEQTKEYERKVVKVCISC
jgi:hypothetical protein